MYKAFLLVLLLVASSAAAQSPAITTYHYDNSRTGWNSNETSLTAVNFPNNFQLQHTVLLPATNDQVDAQPLFVPNLTIASAQHDVVYVVTGANNVYAIDASSGSILVNRNFGTPVPTVNCGNSGSTIGITSTPVIDMNTQTLYIIAYVNNGPTYQLHALNLSTLADKPGSPVTVTASHTLTNNNTFNFDASVHRQRAALLLQGGNIYAGFASFCDNNADRTRGWLLGWNASTLQPLAVNRLNDTVATSSSSFFLSSIWMAGYGIAGDGTDLFFSTGNSDCTIHANPVVCASTFNNPNNIEESIVRLSGDLTTVKGLFSPSNRNTLDSNDTDVGSGGVMLVPPSLAVQAGKDGILNLFDRTSGLASLNTYPISGCWCGPSFFTGTDGIGRVVTSQGSILHTWKVGLTPSPNLVQEGTVNITSGQDPGFFTTVSSNGTNPGTAIIWAVSHPSGNPPNITLYAFEATLSAQVGVMLTASTGTWSNNPNAFSYQWKSAGVNVGTNINTYTPVAGDVGHQITCIVTASNGLGPSLPATSLPTGGVLPAGSGTYRLLFSAVAGSWPNTGGDANLVPIVANGKVYVASAITSGGHTIGQLQIFGIGAPSLLAAPHMAKTIRESSVAALPSPYAVTGILQKVNGSILTLTKRTGSSATVDDSQALANEKIGVPLQTGTAITVQGSFVDPKTGTMLADSVYRAKLPMAIWPPDQ